MNNSNGEAMMARIRAGDLVTVRRSDGGQTTGRAERGSRCAWRIRTGALFSEPVLADRIVRIVPGADVSRACQLTGHSDPELARGCGCG
jgi:hypothetical protein